MNGIIETEKEIEEGSMLSLTAYSCPIQHVSNNDDDYIREPKSYLLSKLKQSKSLKSIKSTKSIKSRKEENEENCIKFPMNEFEDFYLQNLASPELQNEEEEQFNFTDILKEEESTKLRLFLCHYLKTASIPQNIVFVINSYKTDNKKCNFDDDEKVNIPSCLNNHFKRVYQEKQALNVYRNDTDLSNDDISNDDKFIIQQITPSPETDESPSSSYSHPHHQRIISYYNNNGHHQIGTNSYSYSPSTSHSYSCCYSYSCSPPFVAPPPSKPCKATPKLLPFKNISSNMSSNTNNNNQKTPNFTEMSIEEIISLKFGIEDLIRFNLICRFMNDQIGSRHLQKLIKSADCSQCINIISLLINYLISRNIDLAIQSQDIYGNYLIQLFFIYGNDIHHELLLNYFVYQSALKLCKSKYGCRVIQKILSSVKSTHKLIKLVSCFEKQLNDETNSINSNSINSNSINSNVTDSKINKPLNPIKNNGVHECLLCCNTNHVIQAMIELKLPYKSMKFVHLTLENNLVLYSEHIYACRVVQAFVKIYGDKLDINKLLINNAHLFLSKVKYGNYVIQCIVDTDEWYSNLSAINKFRNRLINDVFSETNILYLSKDKHGSNVIETCIRVSNKKQIDYLVKIISSKQGFLLKQLIDDKFGNYIPKTLLENTSKQQTKILINTIHLYVTNLYQYHHSYRQCAKFIQICQGIKYQMDQEYYENQQKYH